MKAYLSLIFGLLGTVISIAIPKGACAQKLWEIPDTNGWNIQGIALSASGQVCLVNTGNDYRSYYVPDGSLIQSYGPAFGPGVALDSTGSLVALAADSGKIAIVNAYSTANNFTIPSPETSANCIVQSLDWSRDGKYLVAAYSGASQQYVVLWELHDLSESDPPSITWVEDVDTARPPPELQAMRLVANFSPSVQFIGIAYRGAVYIFNIQGQYIRTAYGFVSGPLAFSPDERHYWSFGREFDLLDSTYERDAYIDGTGPAAYLTPQTMISLVTPEAGFLVVESIISSNSWTFLVDTPTYYLAASASGSVALTGGRALTAWDFSNYAAVGTTGPAEFHLDAFASNNNIKVVLPTGAESGRVFVYRTDGRCFFSSAVEAGESSVTTSELPSGVYFIVYEPSSGQRSFTKVSLFQ